VIDVAVVRDRLSAYHGTRIPRSLARFVAWLAGDPVNAQRLEERAYLLPAHDLAVGDPSAPLPVRPPGRYHSEPPEFIAYARTGMDGEQMGVLEHAPELHRDELPFVNFFPMEFGSTLCSLGDDLGTALVMLLAYPSVQGPQPLDLPGLLEHPLPAATWTDFEPPAFEAPPGYRFVQSADRAGVLAPAEAFADGAASIGERPSQPVLGHAVERADALLAGGFPASAIVLARDVRFSADGDLVAAACKIWQAAALELGRPWHAAMVEEIAADDRERRAANVYSSTTTMTIWLTGDGESAT
jgi:hypothetical protein